MRRSTYIFALLAALLLCACASIGRPEGGPRDETPPRYVRSNPPAGSVNVSPSRLDVFFDENIKVEDVVNKLVVSPVQKQLPTVSANGHRLSVIFRDTLLPDATYTIDCSDAIRDLNEGNILDGFAIDFSTGPTRDSLVIAGKLFEARNLEPAQGMLVGVHSNLNDSAISTIPFSRIAKTNQFGEFVIRNLAPGSYRVFAINDVNRNYIWDRSEDIAFYDSIVVPEVHAIEVTDTLLSQSMTDSIVTRPGTRYLPNDLLLTWFNENYKSQYLKSYTRPDSMRIDFEFGAPADSLPSLTVINGLLAGTPLGDLALLDRSATRDTLSYWITDPRLASQDTILLKADYMRTDTLDCLSLATDTLRLTWRSKAPSKPKKKVKKEGEDSIDTPELRFLDLSVKSRNPQDLHLPLSITVGEPLASVDSAGVRLEIQVDSLWHSIPGTRLERDSIHRLLGYHIDSRWMPESKYRLVIDSAAVTSVYGVHNKPLTKEFNTKAEEDYSTVTFTIASIPDSASVVVELLNAQDKPVAAKAVSDSKAVFTFVDPGIYYARAFIDRNHNGRWDTGNVALLLQPEDVYYYPKKLNIKKNWDVNQTWDLAELPVDRQKPLDITKNKPKLKDADPNDSSDEDDEYGEYGDEEIDPFTGRPYGADAYGRGGRTRNQSGNRVTGSASMRGGNQTFQR